ncbi:hypothetical protein WN48_06745 [Eufriesea mexicana]|uniref:Uncharacterized protein n=1 Tax=Eufriesea mexicana TaxID=516756 RepID=A0A310SF99_9HYME|nr:hypothetical protein WN48_06745 [Eufriesea mexicana]
MVRPRGVEEAEVAVLFAVDGDENGASTHGWNRHCSPMKSARRPQRLHERKRVVSTTFDVSKRTWRVVDLNRLDGAFEENRVSEVSNRTVLERTGVSQSSCGSELLGLPKIGLRKNRELAKYDWLFLTKGVLLVRESVTLEDFQDSRVPRHEKSKKKGKAVKHAEGMEREIPMPNCSTLRPGCWKIVTGFPCSTTEQQVLDL